MNSSNWRGYSQLFTEAKSVDNRFVKQDYKDGLHPKVKKIKAREVNLFKNDPIKIRIIQSRPFNKACVIQIRFTSNCWITNNQEFLKYKKDLEKKVRIERNNFKSQKKERQILQSSKIPLPDKFNVNQLLRRITTLMVDKKINDHKLQSQQSSVFNPQRFISPRASDKKKLLFSQSLRAGAISLPKKAQGRSNGYTEALRKNNNRQSRFRPLKEKAPKKLNLKNLNMDLNVIGAGSIQKDTGDKFKLIWDSKKVKMYQQKLSVINSRKGSGTPSNFGEDYSKIKLKQDSFQVKLVPKFLESGITKISKILDDSADANGKSIQELITDNFGIKSTPYHKYFNESVEKSRAESEHSEEQEAKGVLKKREKGLFKELEQKFSKIARSNVSARDIQKSCAYDLKFHNLLKRICGDHTKKQFSRHLKMLEFSNGYQVSKRSTTASRSKPLRHLFKSL
ncbi:unnamed protein product [Moneuplotes crassus]|uniref:Uncharacterized protein n=1 Tax=Euplotes crassus TaxID=5936 RepID=A0AAD1XBX0_EUPCR|nr:unnamed protein product [Moneuplotes crassus]